jgi:EmrB/QacA subfamily drug resistance transporter
MDPRRPSPPSGTPERPDPLAVRESRNDPPAPGGAPGSHAESHPRRWYVVGVLIVSLITIVLDNTVLNVALKTLADPVEGLGATQSQLEWAINSYTLVFAGLLFTFGVIGDRVGRKRLLIIGMLLFGLSSLGSAYAQTPEQLIWARAAMGLGGAAVMPQTLSIITNVFDPRERARAIGVWAGAVGIGVALGPITGGLLLQHFWWGSVFFINVPIVLAGVVAAALIVPESRNPRHRSVDPLGVVLSIVGLVSLTYGIIRGGEHADWAQLEVVGPLVAGVVILAAFVWHEARTDQPAFDVRLFRDPRLSAAAGSIALVFFALAGVFFFVTFYLQSVRGLSALEAGLRTLPLAVGQVVFSPLSARMVTRYGAKAVCTVGLIMVAGALASYRFASADSSLWWLEVTFLVQGSGMALVTSPATESIMSVLPKERAGAGSAMTNTARQVAVSFGVAILGSLMSVLYRGQMTGPLSTLPVPQETRRSAGESIGATMGVAERLGPAGARVIEPAQAAFVEAMHVCATFSSVIALLGAVVVFVWMPGLPRSARRSRYAREREPEPARV